jgi:hypothetical protein
LTHPLRKNRNCPQGGGILRIENACYPENCRLHPLYQLFSEKAALLYKSALIQYAVYDKKEAVSPVIPAAFASDQQFSV